MAMYRIVYVFARSFVHAKARCFSLGELNINLQLETLIIAVIHSVLLA